MPSRRASVLICSVLRSKVRIRICDFDIKVLTHLVMVEYRTHCEPNFFFAAQRSLGTPDTGLNFEQVLLGCIEQFAPFAAALVREQRIAADDEALVRIFG